jgi:hypothetical protein
MRTLLGIWNPAHGVVSLVHRTIFQRLYARACAAGQLGSLIIRQLEGDEVRMRYGKGIPVELKDDI